jgi:hypothetical protein
MISWYRYSWENKLSTEMPNKCFIEILAHIGSYLFVKQNEYFSLEYKILRHSQFLLRIVTMISNHKLFDILKKTISFQQFDSVSNRY